LLGLVSLSTDVGQLMSARRQLQNAADAAALAGAQRLPDYASVARTDAGIWAGKNGIASPDTVTTTVRTTSITDDTIQVTVTRNVPYAFARVLGFTSQDVTATATVQRSEDTRLNSSHQIISYAVFCLKKKKPTTAALQ